jgi:hypothetical protein
MAAYNRLSWLVAMMLAGLTYGFIGIVFAIPSSHVRLWRLAAADNGLTFGRCRCAGGIRARRWSDGSCRYGAVAHSLLAVPYRTCRLANYYSGAGIYCGACFCIVADSASE